MQKCGIYGSFFFVCKPNFQTMGCVEFCSVANILEVLVIPIFRVQFNRVSECPYLFYFPSLFLVYKNSVSKFLNFYNNLTLTWDSGHWMQYKLAVYKLLCWQQCDSIGFSLILCSEIKQECLISKRWFLFNKRFPVWTCVTSTYFLRTDVSVNSSFTVLYTWPLRSVDIHGLPVTLSRGPIEQTLVSCAVHMKVGRETISELQWF